MKKWFKNNYIYYGSFFGTMIFLSVLFFFVLKIEPAGDNTLLASDLYDQYINFFNYCRDTILNGEALFHSFNYSIGNNFYGILTYYCLSPLNIIMLFSNTTNIVYFIEVIIGLKICLCSLTMAIYLKNKFNSKNPLIIILAIAYALSSYNFAYMINLMWLDCVILLPLILLGFEKLMVGESKKTYILFLSLAIFTNYYIAFSICLFLIIYFFYYCLSKKMPIREILEKGKVFFLSSFLAGLLNAVVLLSTISNMMSGKFDNASSEINQFFNFNPLSIFSQFLIKNSSFQFFDDMPHIYATIFVLILVILSFFNSKFTKREKIMNLTLIILMCSIMSIGFLDKVFHCFRLPNHFPYRYAFIIPCLLIPIACKSLLNIRELNNKNFRIYLIVLIFIIFLLITNNISFAIISSIILMISYLLILLFIKNRKAIMITTTLFVIFEIIVNILLLYNGNGFIKINEYQRINKYTDVLNTYKPQFDEFYRIEAVKSITNNDSFSLGLYGINTFSPTLTNDTNYFMKDILGFTQKNKYVISNIGGTSFSKSLLGLKYEYRLSNEVDIIENIYAFPVFFKTKNFTKIEFGNLIDNQNSLYKLLADSPENLYEEYDSYIVKGCELEDSKIISKEKKCTFVNTDTSGEYEHYILLKPTGLMYFKLTEFEISSFDYSEELILPIDSDKSIVFTDNIEYIKFYQVKKSKLAALKLKLVQSGVKIDYHDQNNVKLAVEDATEEILFTSIPYDEGWHVIVNGKEAKTLKVLDSVLGVKLPDGDSKIELYFIPKYYISGVIVSSLSLAIIIAIYYRKRHFN